MAPSTLGTFLRGHTFGNVRQFDAVNAEALRRARAAGAGPDPAKAMVIDIDSTICQVVVFLLDVHATYTMPHARHQYDLSRDNEPAMTLTSLLDHLYDGDVLDTADVARVSDTNARSVSRWRADQAAPRREAEERLLELRAVVDLTRKVMRDNAARYWLRSPNPDLRYEKPLELIAQGRYQNVIDLLLSIAEGVTS